MTKIFLIRFRSTAPAALLKGHRDGCDAYLVIFGPNRQFKGRTGMIIYRSLFLFINNPTENILLSKVLIVT